MSFPRWLTPAGNLGIVPELAYYEFDLDAYDENLFAFQGNLLVNSAVITGVSNLDGLVIGQSISGSGIPAGAKITRIGKFANLNITGNTVSISANATASLNSIALSSIPLRYTRVSGVLPEGIQIIASGRLQGIPITTASTPDKNETFTFSIRATNLYTGNISDRTFNLTITNIAPPIITPKTVVNNLELRLQGTVTANIGDFLTQTASGANARVLTSVTNSSAITVTYTTGSPSYIFGSGNLRVISGNLSLYPNVSVNSYPLTGTTVASTSRRDLGLFFDGSEINQQLEVIEFANSSVLNWSVVSGEDSLPPGLTLSSTGLLSGYILPIPAVGPSSNPGWSGSPWDNLGWDFPLGTASKNFIWTVEVNDGVNYDTCVYSMLVYPRRLFTADSTLITIDATTANGVDLGIDTGARHFPIILNRDGQIPEERQGSFLSYQIEAIDLDDDILQYNVPSFTSGAFDEQVLVGNSISYLASTLTTGNVSEGVFPKISTVFSATEIVLFSGNTITANVGDYITQTISNANAQVTASVTNSDRVVVDILSTGTFLAGTGNLYLNGNQLFKPLYNTGTSSWANLSVTPDVVSSGATTSLDFTEPNLIEGDVIQFNEYVPSTNSFVWYKGTVNNYTKIRVTGNTLITASAGSFVTQATGNANAIVANISSTTGTIDIGGALTIAAITIGGGVISANIGDIITQPSSGANVTVTQNIADAISTFVSFNEGSTPLSIGGWLTLRGSNANVYTTGISISSFQALAVSANVGDIITQTVSGANATVIKTQPSGTKLEVVLNNANVFVLGSGNLTIAGNNIRVYPTAISTSTDLDLRYTNSNIFEFNVAPTTNTFCYINGVNTYAVPTKVLSVGVTKGLLSDQGDIGFDEANYDQGSLNLPTGLEIDINSGWITGYLPTQSAVRAEYDFNVIVYKKDYQGYSTTKQFHLTVLGDINNTITWLTPSYLGTIENGAVSDLYIQALSSKGKNLIYEYADNSLIRLPQGLILLNNGLLSGRVSFELFVVDSGETTIDSGTTTFDNTYKFSVTVRDYANTVSDTKEFTLRVLQRVIKPYENLYLKALLSSEQRQQFQNIIQDRTIFPLDKIYRIDDPFFGLARDIKTLFVPGLNPNLLATYAEALETNHFTKRVTFGEIKTAVAIEYNTYNVIENSTDQEIGIFKEGVGFIPFESNLSYQTANAIPAGTKLGDEHVKYEVVYVEVFDENTISNSAGYFGPSNIIDLSAVNNPYYDLLGNSYDIAYPNSFENMTSILASTIDYADKGVLPDWMTSKQADNRVLGFTRAVVLAYTVEGAGELIAYNYRQSGYNLNELDFSVDRYQIDNNYSTNFNVTTGKYIKSSETTFDRYPGLSSVFTESGTVDFAVTISFENINRRAVAQIAIDGGLDGINEFASGDTLIFFNQEFQEGDIIGDLYNLGWSNVSSSWGSEPWDYDTNLSDNPYTEEYGYYVVPWLAGQEFTAGQTVLNANVYYRTEYNFTSSNVFSTTATISGNVTTVLTQLASPDTPDLTLALGWDKSTYVPGSNENLLDPTVVNQRAGVWQINIDSDNIVTLSFVRSLDYYDAVYVRNGFTHGKTHIYYDPIIKTGKTVPNYSVIPEQIRIIATTFDGGGTKFLNYRDNYSVPGQGDKYIKFGKNGVFT
jgi:hypothetical protein